MTAANSAPTAALGSASQGGDAADACAVLREFFERFAFVAKPQAMDALATTDMTFSQLRVLFSVAAADTAPSLQQVADSVRLSLASTGRTVDSLVQLGLIDRREDPDDRRIKRVSLTAEGTRLIDTQLTIRKETVATFVERLPANLRKRLTDAVRPIVADDVDYFTPPQPA